MPTGVIKNILPREGRKKPGAVFFTDGFTARTFDDAVLAQAQRCGKGATVEYTMVNNNGYENLGAIRAVSNGKGGARAVAEAERQMGGFPDQSDRLASLLNKIHMTLQNIEVLLADQPPLRADYQPTPPAAPAPALTPVQQEIAMVERSLIEKLGEQMGRIQIGVERKRAKSDEDLLERLSELYQAHGG